MTISEEQRGKIGILRIVGSFTGRSCVTMFEQAIFNLLKHEIICIVLDLSQLKSIDSSGLGAMISAMVSVGRREGALKLAALEGNINRVVKSMHLDQVFEVHRTVEEAEASFLKSGGNRTTA